MERDPLVYSVIGHAIAVHRELGPGLAELFYQKLLDQCLSAGGIDHLVKPRRSLEHRGVRADVFEPDLVVSERLVAELKVLTGGFGPEHYLQLKTYLKFWRIRHGLLLDFGKERLVTRSFLYDDPVPPQLDAAHLAADAPPTVEPSIAETLSESFARVVATHGFGYRDSTYHRLLAADLGAEGVSCLSAPAVAVRVGEKLLGQAVLPCLVVCGHAGVLVLSQRNGIRAADRAVLQTALRLLDLPWGLIAHFSKHDLQLQWVRSGVDSRGSMQRYCNLPSR